MTSFLFQFTLLFTVSAVALYTDFRYQKIYNTLCLAGLLLAIVLHVISSGFFGAATQIVASLAVSLIIFFPFYLLGGMAAGDVKFMSTCCAILGWPGSMLAVGLTLVVGMVLSVVFVTFRGGFAELKVRFERILVAWMQMSADSIGTETIIPQLDRDPGKRNLSPHDAFPYALAIASGSLIALFWQS